MVIEQRWGKDLAQALGLLRIPGLFGLRIVLTPLFDILRLSLSWLLLGIRSIEFELSGLVSDLSTILPKLALIPSAVAYVLLVYALPILVVARLSAPLANRLAKQLLDRFPLWVSLILHLGLFYATLHLWGGINEYRMLILRYIFISVILTLSLNLVNGYMGEFSCSHPGFMALGAYGASVLTVLFFVNDDVFGAPLLPLPPSLLGQLLGQWIFFPLALIAGGLVAAVGALLVAIPSFRTRGDYLAIISLAFMFIVKSVIENLEIIGGPRGFMNQPKWANLPTMFVWMAICVWVIYNFTRSTIGKALCAVRDDEIAAGAMTINTRRTKMVTFLFAAFWAGVAGGLFAHVIGYINPGTFGVYKLSEILAMVYLGGLNSVVGSIAGAVGLQVLMEVLRPLELWKWIVIPILLIVLMIRRPMGLIAFTAVNVKDLLQPRQVPGEER
ncbi:MAG: branched-chain amino acid ABC transporter permease [Anaerolineales bacterium]|nr:MAG: branched-chain amino acid ABC transporter permease [Anaerolineales bacterium]